MKKLVINEIKCVSGGSNKTTKFIHKYKCNLAFAGINIAIITTGIAMHHYLSSKKANLKNIENMKSNNCMERCYRIVNIKFIINSSYSKYKPYL